MSRIWLVALGLAAAGCGCTGPAPVPVPAPTPAAPAAPAEPAASRPVAPPEDTSTAAPEPVTGNLPGDRVPAFQAKVRRADGEKAREEALDSRATKATTLYIVVSTRCSYCNETAPKMREIEAAFMTKGVDVVYIYPVRSEPEAEKVSWHREKGFAGGMLIDADASIAKGLDTERTPTAYLVDGKGIVVYRGAIQRTDADGGAPVPHLSRALEAHLAGKRIETALTEPEG